MSKRVLIVDDKPDFVDMIKMRLENSGYQVLEAYDGEEGLKKAKNEVPDLVLLDIMMPKKDGYTLLLDLKKDDKTKSIPVIIITIKSGMKDIFKLEGAKDYISKPFEGEELLAKVRKIIG